MRSVSQVFDEWVVDSQTVNMMYGEDKIIQVDSFCDISYFSIELHSTYLGISGCHAVVAYKKNVAEVHPGPLSLCCVGGVAFHILLYCCYLCPTGLHR